MSEWEPLWIDEHDALAIHDRLIVAHGGHSGVRDSALLASALARPRQYYAYTPNPDMIEMAALYTAGIICNHPFLDGNKRTGFVVGVLFLELNDLFFTASEEDATEAVFGLAAGKVDEAEYARWLRDKTRRRKGRS